MAPRDRASDAMPIQRDGLGARHKTRCSLAESLSHAAAGIAFVVRAERNARIHVAIGALVVLVGMAVGLAPGEWALLLLTIGVMLAGEMLNTAIELVVDMVQPQDHPLAGHAKDVAAGATLVLACASVAVGLVILAPKLWARLFT